mgnify:CR=1 FL=1
MVAKKLGKSQFKGEFKIIKTFLTSLGFELDRVGIHGSIWKNHAKNLTTTVATSSSDCRWFNNWKSDFGNLVKENFTRDEIETLLERYIKKRKVKFTDDGRLRILRADPRVASGEDFIKVNPDEIWVTFNDVEGELLSELLHDLQDGFYFLNIQFNICSCFCT